jgi:hypothetical protein
MMGAPARAPDPEVAMPRSRRDVLQTVLLVVAVLAGLVAVRWAVTGGSGRSLAPPALTSAPSRPDRGPARTIAAPPRTRLSLGGRQPIVVNPAGGTVTRLPFNPRTRTVLFRQGAHTVFLSNERAWAAPAGRVAPLRPLGRALAVLPALVDDRVWLVDARYGEPEAQLYELVEVGLADGRTHTRWTLPYQAAPVAVLPSGVLARDPEDNLQVVAPGSGRVRTVLARAATFVDARDGRVAWVEGRDLHVRDLATGTDTVVPPPPGSPDWYALGGPVPRVACCYGLGAFDPAGRTLAVYTRLAGPGAPGLAIVDLVRGSAALLPGSEDATPTGCLPCLGWASNGWLYFFAAGPAVTSIGAWRGGAGPAGLLPLDLDGVLDSVPSALAAN